MQLFGPGARVSQPQYGDGTVILANIYHIKIDFDAHGPRTFVTTRASLTPSATAAPVKVSKGRRKRVAVPAAATVKSA